MTIKRLGLLFIALILIVGLLLPAPVVEASFLYEYYNTNDDTAYDLFGIVWRAQTFTPSVTHKITSVKLKLYRVGSPGTIVVGIRVTDEDGFPTGGDLCNATTDGNTLTEGTNGEMREILLGAGYNLSATTQYAIVTRALTGDESNKVRWRNDATSPTYPGGRMGWSTNSGATWGGSECDDFMFEVWGGASAAPTITTNNATYVTRTTARLNSYLVDDGSEPCDVRFQYDQAPSGSGGGISENQTEYDSFNKIYTGLWVRAGQLLVIPNRTVLKLAFPIKKIGSPTGDVNFTIRYAGNDTLINSKTWGNASDLTGLSAKWEEATFVSPVLVNGTVRIQVEFYAGNVGNYVEYNHEDVNEKNNENFTHYNGAAYTQHATYDGAYNYTYGAGGNYSDSTPWINDTYTTGNSPYADIASLAIDTTYYFRVQARNSIGLVNGSELNFTTLPAIFEPTNFTAYPNSTSISLTWIKGIGATYTMIRGQAGAYPANYTSGTQVYAGFMSTALHSGLTSGTTYYYRSWSYDGIGYSDNYTDILMTTSVSEEDVTETPAEPGTPSNWWGMPDYTRLSNIAGYAFINEIADEYNIPYNTFWMALILVMIMCIGLFIYSVQHNATVAIVLTSVMIVVASIGGLLPLLFIAIIGIPTAGIMLVKRRI